MNELIVQYVITKVTLQAVKEFILWNGEDDLDPPSHNHTVQTKTNNKQQQKQR